ncbi:MAG TPA: phytoene desaturase family protein [Geminicoccaceae bacterium]
MRRERTVVAGPPTSTSLRYVGPSRMSRPQVVIAGAGPGGLAAAMLLAHAGAGVVVLERRDRVGGRSATLHAGGFRFDLGPTFFLYPQILAEIFAACGHRLEDEVELLRLDPMYHLMFEAGGEIRASADLARLTADITKLSPQDAAAVPRFMNDNRAKFEAFRPVLQRPFASWRDLLTPDLLRALPALRPFRSVDGDLARYFSDPRVRLAFSFQSKYLGMSPFKCPSLFTILSFMEYEHGVFHPRGGCGAVMEAMAGAARRAGAQIRLNEPITEILFEGRRAVGVRTDRGDYRSDALVINADFAKTMTSLVPDRLRRRWSDRRLAKKRYSCSTFMMYLGIEGRFDDLAHHTIFLAEDYRSNVRAIDAGDAPPAAPSLYVQNACVTDPEQAPPGHSTLYVLVPVGNLEGGIDWRAEASRYRELVLRRLAAMGIDNLERRIRFEKIITPVDWEHDMQIYRGATFNLAHNMGQMLHNRPRNRFEDLDQVYLVGGGTHPGSGLPVIFESARITSRLLAQDLGLALPSGVVRPDCPPVQLARAS